AENVRTVLPFCVLHQPFRRPDYGILVTGLSGDNLPEDVVVETEMRRPGQVIPTWPLGFNAIELPFARNEGPVTCLLHVIAKRFYTGVHVAKLHIIPEII